MKGKWWGLAQRTYSPQGNGRQSPTVEPFKQRDVAEGRRKGVSGRKVGGAIRSLVNARGLQLEGAASGITHACSDVWQ